MKQLFATILYFSIVLPCHAQLKWSADSMITWVNFKGIAMEGFNQEALTNTSLDIRYNCNKQCLYYKVEAVFNEHLSWVVVQSDILLMHERDHFNIQELYARKIRKYLQDCLLEKVTEDEIHLNVDRLAQQCKSYQELYDEETDHSRNARKQRAWSMQIQSQLKSLQAYSEAEVIICK